MQQYSVLFNPKVGNKERLGRMSDMEAPFGPEVKFVYRDITKLDDPYGYIHGLPEGERVVIAGGDGTLNRLVNLFAGRRAGRELFYYPIGSGNDFAADVAPEPENGLIPLNRYIERLPAVTVNGERHSFINGVGYGIDGYCCEIGDRQRAVSDRPVNYTAIAIKGLLYGYKPVNAEVTVDGVRHSYERVWLAPTMNGRFYGGGMMVAPGQDRLGDGKLSVVVMHGSGKLKTLCVFPSIFKGEHVKHTEMVEVLRGDDITVEFDRPTALQIDGETITGVTRCQSLSAAFCSVAAGAK